jgi:hypothetical protein
MIQDNGPQAVVLTTPAGLTRTLEGPRIELDQILANSQFPAIQLELNRRLSWVKQLSRPNP